jgi:hypothetical protein
VSYTFGTLVGSMREHPIRTGAFAVLLLATAACGVDAEPLTSPAAPRGREQPGPAPQARAAGYDPVVENAACERCHADVAAEWRASMHRSAWDDQVFLAAFAVEPLAFCRHCHAPEVAETKHADDPSRHLGVGRVTCHVLDDRILGTRELPSREGAHAVVAAPEMAGVGWCQGCHQFAFPESQDAPMQGTVAEHAASRFSDRSCQDCHMPHVDDGGRKRRSPAFRVQGDEALLRSSIATNAWRNGDRSIVVSLRAANVGHAVPTGDMFRRLEVRAFSSDGDGSQTAKPAVLARRFVREQTPEGTRRLQIGDTRVPADGEPAEVELFFARPVEDARIEWQVVYRRMGPHEAALFGVDLAKEETLLASGVLEGETNDGGKSE